MNEAGVLGRFVRAFGRIVAMMQFNMYHHYTVDEHLLRCIGILADIEAGGSDEYVLASELMKTIQKPHRALLYVALFLHDIAKGRIEDHSIAGARIARRFCPRLGLSAAETDTVAWLIEQHLVMSSIAQSRDLSDRKTIENFAATVQSLERMKLLLILTTADIHYPAYWLKVDLAHKVSNAHFLKSAQEAGKGVATGVGFDAARGVTELTVLAPDHPRLLSVIAGACAATGANIVDAQIFTTTDGLALDTIAISREFEHNEDEARRAMRIADSIEKALRGELRLPDVMAKRTARKGRLKAFAVEPEVMLNNQWSNRYTVVEVTGLDRPGLLHELTATISKLNLNIASAHVATFGERVVDVFYVTDLLGAQITAPSRQAAIKRALLPLFTEDERKAAKAG